MNSHNVIKREQTYELITKQISIHSEDRDINIWKQPSEFAVELPEDLRNVVSIRLTNAIIPSNQYVFTNNYQNTKLAFKIAPDISGNTGSEYEFLNDISNALLETIAVNEGFYDPDQLATEISRILNDTITELYSSDVDLSNTTYSHFTCIYNNIEHKLIFGNNRDFFEIVPNKQIEYNIECGYKQVYDNYAKWGLPYYLGFEKFNTYVSLEHDNGIFDGNTWIEPDVSSSTVKIITPTNVLDIFGENTVYMELERYNDTMELIPYVEQTNSSVREARSTQLNHDSGGSPNASFAVIPMIRVPYSYIFNANDPINKNYTNFSTPIERIQKFKFRFRYHDGRLMDLKGLNLSFILEIYMLRNEQYRPYVVRMPFMNL
jgi:hypothetical protein